MITLKPKYPKQIIRQPYYLGIITGSMLGLGVGLTYLGEVWFGVILTILATVLYYRQTIRDENFIDVH